MGKDSMTKEEFKAVTQQVQRWTYRLIDRTNPAGGGTGISIKIGDRLFVATAGHVISKNHEYLLVLRNGVVHSISSFVARHIDEHADVGLLEVAADDYEYLIEGCASLANVYTQPEQRAENSVIVGGYPGEYIVRTARKQITEDSDLEVQLCNSLCYLSVTIPVRKWPTEGTERKPEEGRDVFVDYEPGDMFVSLPNTVDIDQAESLQCPKLPGMSGGGIWLLQSKDDVIWRPDAKLIGIQCSVHEQYKWMRGSLIHTWLRLVAKEYPELCEQFGSIDNESHE